MHSYLVTTIRWKQGNPAGAELPKDLKEMYVRETSYLLQLLRGFLCDIIRSNIEDNNAIAERHRHQLHVLEDANKTLQHDIPVKITAQERRQLLDMLIRSQELEVESRHCFVFVFFS